MFDQEEPKTLEEQVKDLKADVDYLRIRISSIEDEVKELKEAMRKISFTPGL